MIIYTLFEILIFTIPFFLINNLVERNSSNVFFILFLLGISYLLKCLFEYLYQNLLIILTENYRLNLVSELIDKIKSTNIKSYLKNKDKYISWIKNDVDTITNFKCFNFYEIIRNSLFLIISFLILFKISKIIFIINILGLIIIHKISKRKLTISENIYKNLSIAQEKYFSSITNLFDCISLFYFSNKRQNFNKRFNYFNELYVEEISDNLYKLNNSYFFIYFGSIFLQLISILLTNIFIILGYLKIGSIQTISFIIGNSSNQITIILNLYMQYNSVDLILEKFNNMDDYLKSYDLEKINSIDSITFENVSLNFGDKIIFNNFNYTFNKNKKYLITGENGIGKSSLIKLLLGEIDNYKGNIYINNINLKNIDKKSLFNNIEYIDSTNFIFNYSIYDNISLFNDRNDEKINKILNKLNLNIENNEINENNLSTGQKQRINLARIFYNKKNTIILDEALTNIDKDNLEKIMNLLFNQNKFIILISHNINNFKYFDEIIELNNIQEGENIL